MLSPTVGDDKSPLFLTAAGLRAGLAGPEAAAAAAPIELSRSREAVRGVNSEEAEISRSESLMTRFAASTRLFQSMFPAAASGSGKQTEVGFEETTEDAVVVCRPGGPAAPNEEEGDFDEEDKVTFWEEEEEDRAADVGVKECGTEVALEALT